MSFHNYSVTFLPEFHNSYLLNCSFTVENSSCVFPNQTFEYFSLKLMFSFNVHSLFYSESVSIAIDTRHYQESLNILKEIPFIIDTMTPSTSVEFTTSKKFNPSWEYFCQSTLIYINSSVGSIQTKLQVSNNTNIVNCQIDSKNIEEMLNVSFHFNKSTTIPDFTSKISYYDSVIEFASKSTNLLTLEISFSPSFSEFDEIMNITLGKNKTSLSVPSKYQDDNYQLISTNSGENIAFSCFIQSSNFVCKKNPVALIESNDITFLNFKIQRNNVDFGLISQRFYIYSNSILLFI
jgi:hypothetical protein